MPIKGSLTLADVAARTDMLAVACSRCDRAGRYPLARLMTAGCGYLTHQAPNLIRVTPCSVMNWSISSPAICSAWP
jgi:hypothetical protein